MILNVDDTSKKLMEEIRDSISGEILRKLDEYKIILKDVQENPVDISNLSEKSDIEKIKRNLDRLYENIEDILDNINKRIMDNKNTVINAMQNNSTKDDFENLATIVNNIKNEVEKIKDSENKIERHINYKINNIEKEQSNILSKLNSMESTLEYLSLPFFKRLFGMRKNE
ncbi:hypothetical protein EPJ64_12040 [Brachyspira aalborgi]|jgi:phage-related protein|uniref:Uncharacterized protein n=1 Tax=Brachyspira aalborgi TaxID=29522 RepID=A0AB38PY73_9SPIR|nr:hypothetical protein [Brachyspira aalborgi]MBS4762558.1 hypothetical protein [Brachyspira sp.]CCY75684.1 unknown [Brachyspira sp. CAG:700]TXJ14753.1 hypothetical protein EPJ77_06185 [Brachyspira aalborgi]TXJ18612.1 hypothetical protein EPJ64_12040 [Brachyspira aalborgi]TXJ24585.1 hypothetical protein EPJ73_12235 [Brachyspira aalborgi]